MSNRSLSIILPIICGLTAANVYYIQPLIPEVAQLAGVGYSIISMIYTMALIGSAIALTFITPMGDFINRKKIISCLYMMLFAVLLLFYISDNIYVLIAISFFIGLGSCVIPMIIAHLSTNKTSGIGSIGKIMAGVLFGILLSRFVSSFFASIWGWKSIYLFAAGCMLISLVLISYFLPQDDSKKEEKIGYFKMALSSFSLLKSNASVRLYSINGFLIMAVFSVFWNNISIYLRHEFSFDQFSIGLFSLAGVLGALAAMFSNKALKFFKSSNAILFMLLFACFLLMTFYSSYLVTLVLLTLALDGLIQLIHVNNQVNMYRDCCGNESRAASCYMTSFVLGGAIGAKLSIYIYLDYGWAGLSIFCSGLC
ncbi:MAG: MFS transporter, partial [Gammaproteobacteria bacterium]|nr:MFS transporter [Gammaproteobacteria bacterium]